MLYGQSLAGAKAFAEELRQQVEAMDTGVCPVTIFIGVTRYNGRDNYQLAVQCADKALYQAKKLRQKPGCGIRRKGRVQK